MYTSSTSSAHYVFFNAAGEETANMVPTLNAPCCYVTTCTILIKTHDSESRGQEEAGRTRRTSELFTRSTALKFVNALNKPP